MYHPISLKPNKLLYLNNINLKIDGKPGED